MSEGYLTTRNGSGTFVATELPDAWFEAKRAPAKRPRGARADRTSRAGRDRSTPPPFPTKPQRAMRPFHAHTPDVGAFPRAEWARLVARRARQSSSSLLTDIDPHGHRPLREALAEHLRVARGVVCSTDQVVITPSVQQALDLAARLVLDPGDRAWIEDPAYVGARASLEAAGAEVIPIPVDERGLDVAHGIACAPGARLAYVTPAHQAPLGVTLSLERRLMLLDWAQSRGAWIFEDDYDSEFRYEGRPLPALQGIDRAGVVLHAGSFSKTLFPSLRLAYVIVPDGLLDRFIAAKTIVDRFTPPFAQAVLADFLVEGHFGRHLRRMRERYAERRAALLGALASEFGCGLEVIERRRGARSQRVAAARVDDRAAMSALAAASIDAMALSLQAINRPEQRRPPARLRAVLPSAPAQERGDHAPRPRAAASERPRDEFKSKSRSAALSGERYLPLMSTKTEALAVTVVNDPRWRPWSPVTPGPTAASFTRSRRPACIAALPAARARLGPRTSSFMRRRPRPSRRASAPASAASPTNPRWPSSRQARWPSSVASSRAPSRRPASKSWRAALG